MDREAMTTPMASNLNLLSHASSKSFDSTMCHQMIGSFMYLTNTRPDIFFVVNTLSQFLTDPRHVHLIDANHILRYLKVTVNYGLKYDVNQKINLEGYVESDQEGNSIDNKSTSGCFFSMGSGMISWFNRKQSCMAPSIAEAEYVAACLASCEAVWLRKLLSDLFHLQMDATCIYYDNQRSANFSKYPMFHDKLQHIQIKYHYSSGMVQRGAVKI